VVKTATQTFNCSTEKMGTLLGPVNVTSATIEISHLAYKFAPGTGVRCTREVENPPGIIGINKTGI
jgi:hypothetical protein